MRRSAGILMPISALPSRYGIGTLGEAAYEFIDFLEAAGQSYWQILPIGPTGYGDSPYQSFSAFAGNPYFIDLDLLARDGWLKKEEYSEIHWGDDPGRTDYGTLYKRRFDVLRKAVKRLLADVPDDYEAFAEKNAFWLDDYAL
ncbi:MAG: 4-alpha-glucanotransferase, partial [Lactimicrobium massiliense]